LKFDLKLFLNISWLIIMIIVGCLQFYALFYVFPTEKALFEECNYKILCQRGYFPANPDCEISQNVLLNLTESGIIVGTTTII